MINVYHLKYFCDACRAENMSEAARINRVSHSAVSQAIRSLESTLGVKLVRHAKKHFELTPEAHELFAKAAGIFDSLQNLSEFSGDIAGPLSIGLSHSLAMTVTAEPLERFLKRHPQVTPNLNIGNSAQLARMLANREIEIGFGIDDGSFAPFERKMIRRGRFGLFAKPGSAKTYLIGDKGPEVRALHAELRGTNSSRITVQSWAVAADMASRGLGVSLMPDFMKGRLTAVQKSIALPSYELCIFFRSQNSLSRNARAFIETFDSLSPTKKGRGLHAQRPLP